VIKNENRWDDEKDVENTDQDEDYEEDKKSI
jgi:hypothetical protein